jgi:hypothetical protein
VAVLLQSAPTDWNPWAKGATQGIVDMKAKPGQTVRGRNPVLRSNRKLRRVRKSLFSPMLSTANSVWSNDLKRSARVAEAMVAGNSWINAHNLFPHGVPYGGVNRSGTGGGVNSPETLLDYWRSQSVVRPY